MEKLEEGRVYQSKTHGLVKYIGVDVFYGETNLCFELLDGDRRNHRHYWLPRVLSDHIEGVRI